jgi:NitT/TauT family transport system substrate-binding protein
VSVPRLLGPNSKIGELENDGVYSHPMKIKVAPKGMGLNDFVAFEEGFFQAEGLEVELDWKTFRGTQSSWKRMEYFERPQDKAVGEQVIQCACLWGTISNASAGMGLIVPDCYGISPWSIFVRRDSKICKPEDLCDIPVAVGMRAGSHFNVPYRLEKYMPLENVKTVNIGGFGARLKALLEGEVEAASLLPPQIDMAKQLGLHEVIADEFKTLWWVPGSAEASAVRGYVRGLDHAERVLEMDLQKYLPLWEHCIPPEFQDRYWDFSRFSRGERFVYQPILPQEFDEVMQQVERWGLDQYLKDRSFENLVYRY